MNVISFKELDAFNGRYVRIAWNNGQRVSEGVLKTQYGTLFMVEERFDDVLIDCHYDIRDIAEIIEVE